MPLDNGHPAGAPRTVVMAVAFARTSRRRDCPSRRVLRWEERSSTDRVLGLVLLPPAAWTIRWGSGSSMPRSGRSAPSCRSMESDRPAGRRVAHEATCRRDQLGRGLRSPPSSSAGTSTHHTLTRSPRRSPRRFPDADLVTSNRPDAGGWNERVGGLPSGSSRRGAKSAERRSARTSSRSGRARSGRGSRCNAPPSTGRRRRRVTRSLPVIRLRIVAATSSGVDTRFSSD